jgi:drug/metabolite transporter (DMT)-like permease
MPKRDPRPARWGYLAVLGAAAAWASSASVGKSLFGGDLSPLDVTQVRCLGAALVLALVFAVTGQWRLFAVRRRDLPLLTLLGAGVMAFVQLSYFEAIARLQVAAAILLQYLSPVLVFVFAALWWKERPTVPKLVALVLAVGGVYLVAGGYDLALLTQSRAGILWGLGSAVGFAAYSLIGEKLLQRYRPWTVLFYAVALGAITCHLLGWPPGWFADRPSPGEWARLAYVVVIGTTLPFGLYYVGVSHLRASRTNVVASSEPVLAAVFAYAFLGETLAPPQLIGGAAVIGAVVLLGLRHEPDDLAPERLRAPDDAG